MPWHALFASLLRLAAVLAGLLAPGSTHAQSQAPAASPVIVVQQALFQRLDAGGPADGQTVHLPDTWAARGLPLAGSGRYRLSLPLPAAPEGVWALRIDRLGTAYSLRVNGVLVQQRDGPAGLSALPRPQAVLAEFPAQMLRQGGNQIDIEWRLGFRAGMSDVQIGPSPLLQPGFERELHIGHTVPLFLNSAGAALAGFMLLIWWRRRRETALGVFGLLWLLLSLRDISYYVNASPLPGWLASALFFVAQTGSVLLLCAFAVAMSPGTWPRFKRLLWALAVALPLLALAAAGSGHLETLRQLAYPGLMVLAVAGLAVLWRWVRQVRRWTVLALVLGLSTAVVAGGHDYLFQQGLLPVTHFFWLPFAAPLGCMWFAVALIQRMVQALRQSEELAARLEARVAERTQALNDANAAQGRFLAAASHDLRQPVAAIGLLVGLVRERAEAPEQRRLLDRVQDATRALEDLLRGLLDLSRLDTDALAPQHQPVALQALFDAIAAHERPAALAKGLRLHFVPSHQWVSSDPVLLGQVLRNLVGNALRYTALGGVMVTARRSAGAVRLQVWDTGRGIAPADQQRIFEPFVQLDNPERDRHKGQGLGLAIVRRSVDLLGHALALRSVPGRGSCFTLTLPAAQGASETTHAGAMPARPLAGLRLWLLDDDAAVRLALVDRLVAWGAQVRAHASLADLAHTLADTLADSLPAPDWLLTDHRLPDGDGLQAIAQVRAQCGPLPVLMITGDTSPALAARVAQQGQAVLHKPVRAEQLLQQLLAQRSPS